MKFVFIKISLNNVEHCSQAICFTSWRSRHGPDASNVLMGGTDEAHVPLFAHPSRVVEHTKQWTNISSHKRQRTYPAAEQCYDPSVPSVPTDQKSLSHRQPSISYHEPSQSHAVHIPTAHQTMATLLFLPTQWSINCGWENTEPIILKHAADGLCWSADRTTILTRRYINPVN